jgi:hypothetical protein
MVVLADFDVNPEVLTQQSENLFDEPKGLEVYIFFKQYPFQITKNRFASKLFATICTTGAFFVICFLPPPTFFRFLAL